MQIFLFRSTPEAALSNYILFVKRGISERGEMNDFHIYYQFFFQFQASVDANGAYAGMQPITMYVKSRSEETDFFFHCTLGHRPPPRSNSLFVFTIFQCPPVSPGGRGQGRCVMLEMTDGKDVK